MGGGEGGKSMKERKREIFQTDQILENKIWGECLCLLCMYVCVSVNVSARVCMCKIIFF